MPRAQHNFYFHFVQPGNSTFYCLPKIYCAADCHLSLGTYICKMDLKLTSDPPLGFASIRDGPHVCALPSDILEKDKFS